MNKQKGVRLYEEGTKPGADCRPLFYTASITYTCITSHMYAFDACAVRYSRISGPKRGMVPDAFYICVAGPAMNNLERHFGGKNRFITNPPVDEASSLASTKMRLHIQAQTVIGRGQNVRLIEK